MMRACDVNRNLKNWLAWSYNDYKMPENEAKTCTDALENYIWHSVEKEGLPTEDGWYVFKQWLHVFKKLLKEDSTHCYYICDRVIDGKLSEYANHELNTSEWRKIVDEPNSWPEEVNKGGKENGEN